MAGLDLVLGGGVPELSFNLIAGGPGAGKTTLAQQIVFANATRQRPALYFTVLGEPTMKMLRYQRQFTFFDLARVGVDVHLLNLAAEALSGDLDTVLGRIISEVERYQPGVVVVDSFRTIGPQGAGAPPESLARLEHFVQRLALQLTTWETTSFLISEYAVDEQRHPVFTVADGVFWLSQVVEGSAVVRKLQVVKARGQSFMPGLHTYHITDAGVGVFPRLPDTSDRWWRPGAEGRASPAVSAPARRIATGVPGLDPLLGGGIPAADALLLAGTTGTGKTTIATQFVRQGAADGAASVLVKFEESPDAYLDRATALGMDLRALIAADRLRVLALRPLDLSVDETLAAILAAVGEIGATRVVLDSLSGFEVALAPAGRVEFREAVHRLVRALTGRGVTMLIVTELTGTPLDVGPATEQIAFAADAVVVLRHVELDGVLRLVLAVLKMRGSDHAHAVHEYTLGASGAIVGTPLRGYRGLLSGRPTPEARGTDDAVPHG